MRLRALLREVDMSAEPGSPTIVCQYSRYVFPSLPPRADAHFATSPLRPTPSQHTSYGPQRV
jgi:hypothetical protein